jgi:hypothetical protein
MDGGAHLRALAELAGVEGPGVVIAQNGPMLVPAGLEPVSVSENAAARHGWRVVHHNVADPDLEWPAHNPVALGQVLGGLAAAA